MHTFTCNNCKEQFDGNNTDSLITEQGGNIAAALCSKCCDGVKVAKIVLRRNAHGDFQYEQYSPVEMVAKAFGR